MIKIGNGIHISLPLLFISVFLLPYEVNGLKCFECTTSEGETCNPSKCQLTECKLSIFTIDAFARIHEDVSKYACLSTTERNGSSTLCTRRCALQSEATLCDESYEECSFCEEDYCNHAAGIKNNILFLLFVVLVCYL